MPKVKVVVNMVHHPKGTFLKDGIIEDTAESCAAMVKDGICVHVGDAEQESEGIQRQIDPLDQAVRDRKFDEAKGAAAQEGIKTPDPSADPRKPAAPERLPGDAIVRDIKEGIE